LVPKGVTVDVRVAVGRGREWRIPIAAVDQFPLTVGLAMQFHSPHRKQS
jgi:hypothetical protein